MKKIIVFLLFVLLIPVSSYAQDKNALLVETLDAMSTLRTYIEFYFMNTGNYPRTLQDLDLIFNEGVKKESDRILLPLEPSLSKPFVYKVSSDLKSYTLSSSEPSRYGLEKLQFTPVRWGWMNDIAKNIDMAAKTDLCGRYLSGLIMAVKAFQEKEKRLPSDIKDLVPSFLKGVPLCPKCGKPYILTRTKDDLIVSCPEPESHLLKVFRYSLRKGAERS